MAYKFYHNKAAFLKLPSQNKQNYTKQPQDLKITVLQKLI